MINKIYKTINSKFSRFFKFVFFLRYLFVIFFVAIVFFFIIPQFFDYKKKEKTIKKYLYQNYSLEIKSLDHIKYYFFPFPHLKIINLSSNYNSTSLKLETELLTIYPELFSIYNYENFKVRKIKLENNKFETDFKNVNDLKKILLNSENKIFFKNLDLQLKESNNSIIDFKNIDYANYGYRKNRIIGKVFNKKFKIYIKDDIKNINFKMPGAGISSNFNILETKKNSGFKGVLKGKVLKTNFKLNFDYNNKLLKINNLFFRGRELSFDSKGKIDISPFFKASLTSNIKNINPNLLKKIDIDNLLNFKDFIKKINAQKIIIFKSQRFHRNLINNLNIDSDLSYGRLKISKIFFIGKSRFVCKNNINLLEEFPILYFNCQINSADKKELLKKININYKKRNESLNLNIQGKINVLNNKINFERIQANTNYSANKEDLVFFKKKFEEKLFDENFIEIFSLLKIKKFVEEIY